MHYTTLGKTGLKVSVAGLGCGGNSRIGLGTGLSEAQSVALVREALDLGVNFLDTAAAYETEPIVGKAIKGRARDSVVISTKSHATSASTVLANLDNSLRQLDTDYVDVFHLHGLGPAAYDGAMKDIVPALMKHFQYANIMAVPKLEKIVVNMGLGEAIANAKIMDVAVGELGLITGQRAVVTRAKKSIANFKLRQHMPIGAAVTLRGDRMYEFLDRLLSVVLPRVRDFRGVSTK